MRGREFRVHWPSDLVASGEKKQTWLSCQRKVQLYHCRTMTAQCSLERRRVGQTAQPLAWSLKGVALRLFDWRVFSFKSKEAGLQCKQLSLLCLCFVEAVPLVKRFNNAARAGVGGWPWGPWVVQLEKLGNLRSYQNRSCLQRGSSHRNTMEIQRMHS